MSDDNVAAITATSTIRKAKSAYQYYQSAMLSKIRNEMGGSNSVSMGDTMTEVCNIMYSGILVSVCNILYCCSNSCLMNPFSVLS